MMSFLKSALEKASRAVASYQGDQAFLLGAASAAANVTAADGSIDDSEIESAIGGMMANPILSASYTAAKIEEEVGNGLRRAKTRAGKMENRRFIEALATRPVELRQDVFLIAADVADNGGIGDAEKRALDEIAKSLNVDGAKLLG